MSQDSGPGARMDVPAGGTGQQQKPLAELVHSALEEDLRAAASDPQLGEDLAKVLLQRHDLPASVLQDLGQNTAAMKLRSVLVGLVCHVHTPRWISLPAAKHLYTFELVQVALQPAVPSDIKRAVENVILAKIENISSGERLTLAKRGPTRLAAALLGDPEPRIFEAALNNPFLTEASVAGALMRDDSHPSFAAAVFRHERWRYRREVQVALLRNPRAPVEQALMIAQALPANVARDALHTSRLPAGVKTYLMSQIQQRSRSGH